MASSSSDPKVANLLPHEGNVCVERDPFTQSMWLVNMVSMERQLVSGFSNVKLEFDEGDGVLMCWNETCEDVAYKCVGEVLEYDVYMDTDNNPVLVSNQKSDERKVLAEEVSKHELLDLKLEFGLPKRQMDTTVAAFKWPLHHGLAIRWNLHSLYDLLGLKSHGGHRWTWVSKNWEPWSSFLKTLWSGEPGLHKAQQTNKSIDEDGENVNRCLGWPSVTTAALLALLSRFCATSAPQAGALSTPTDREAAKELLRAVLALLHEQSFKLNLLLDTHAVLRWPLPPSGNNAATFDVNGNQFVDVGSQQPTELENPNDPCVNVFSALGVNVNDPLCLLTFFLKLAAWRPRRSNRGKVLLGQLCVSVAQTIDRVIMDLAECKDATWVLKRQSFNPHKCSPQELHVAVLKYWESQKAFCKRQDITCLSVASDKSRVLGMSLLNTCMVVPGNLACWCFPVVPMGIFCPSLKSVIPESLRVQDT